jgi:hypothetical protein
MLIGKSSELMEFFIGIFVIFFYLIYQKIIYLYFFII